MGRPVHRALRIFRLTRWFQIDSLSTRPSHRFGANPAERKNPSGQARHSREGLSGSDTTGVASGRVLGLER